MPAAAAIQAASTANSTSVAIAAQPAAVAHEIISEPLSGVRVASAQEIDNSANLQADDMQYDEITPAPSPVGWPPQDDADSAAQPAADALREKLAAAVTQFSATIPAENRLPIPPQTPSNYIVEYTARRKKDVLGLGVASLFQEEFNSKKIAKRKASAAQRQQQQDNAPADQEEERATPPLQIAIPEADEFTDPERRQEILRRNALASIKRRVPRRSKPKTAEKLFEMEKVYYGPKIDFRQGEEEWCATYHEIKKLFSNKPELASLDNKRMWLIIDVLTTIGDAMMMLGSNQKIPFQQLFPQDARPGATPAECHAKRESYRNFRAVFGECRSARKLKPSEIFAFVYFDNGYTGAPQLLQMILKRGYYANFYKELHHEVGKIRSYIETEKAEHVYPALHAWSIESQGRIAELMHKENESANSERTDSEFYDSEDEPTKKKPKKQETANAKRKEKREKVWFCF